MTHYTDGRHWSNEAQAWELDESEMIMYNVDFKLGQALVNAENEEAAKQYAKAEWGNMHGPYTITEATKKDYAWVKCTGGIVHEAA